MQHYLLLWLSLVLVSDDLLLCLLELGEKTDCFTFEAFSRKIALDTFLADCPVWDTCHLRGIPTTLKDAPIWIILFLTSRKITISEQIWFQFFGRWEMESAKKNFLWLRGYLHETGTNSDRHEFVSTSIHFFFCVYMRPARKWTQTGLTSSRLLERDEKFSYRSEFVPFSCKWQQISDRVQKFQACMLLGQRYIYLTKHVILSRNQAPSISSRFHVNGCKNFIPVWVRPGLM